MGFLDISHVGKTRFDDSSWRAPAPSTGNSSNPRERVHHGGRAGFFGPQHPTACQGHYVWKVCRLSRPKASGPGSPPRLTSLEYRGARRRGHNCVGPPRQSWTYGLEEEHRIKGSRTVQQQVRVRMKTSRRLRKRLRLRLPPWGAFGDRTGRWVGKASGSAARP